MASRKIYLARNLEDVDVSGADDNDSLVWDAGASLWKPVAISGGGGSASAFTDLTDVPSSYVTFSGYVVQVKSTEDGLEFVAPSAGATSMMTVVNTNWDDTQDAHTADTTWEYITNCSGIITTEEDDGIIRCDWNGIIKYDDSNWEYFYLRFQLDTPDGTYYSPTMTHQFNSGANTTKYNIESIMFVWSGMPAGTYVMRPQVILTSNMNASFYARTGSIRGDWPVSGGGGGGGGASAFTDLSDTPSDYTDDGGKYVKVNVGETALEFVAATIPDEFTDLTDTPASLAGGGGKLVAVNDGETSLEFVPSGVYPTAFLGLGDTPSAYAGQSGKVPAVTAGENALEFITVAGGVTDFPDLGDTPANYTAASGKYVRVNDDEDALIFDTPAGGGASAFTDLSDVPSSYSGQGGKAVTVKDAEDGLEFTTAGGGGGGALAAFRAQITGNWDVGTTNSWVKVPFDAEDFDTASYYDPTTNYRWTPPSGICHVSVISEWTDVNTSNVRIGLYKNGAIIAQGMINRYNQSVSADVWDQCNGTDYYEVYGFRGSFSNADIVDSTGTKFSGAVFTAP